MLSFVWNLGKRLVLFFPLLAFSVGAEEGDVIATDRTLSGSRTATRASLNLPCLRRRMADDGYLLAPETARTVG